MRARIFVSDVSAMSEHEFSDVDSFSDDSSDDECTQVTLKDPLNNHSISRLADFVEIIAKIRQPTTKPLLTKNSQKTPIFGKRVYLGAIRDKETKAFNVGIFNLKGAQTHSYDDDSSVRQIIRKIDQQTRDDIVINTVLMDVVLNSKNPQILDMFFVNGENLISNSMTQRLYLMGKMFTFNFTDPITTEGADVLIRDGDLSAEFRYDYRQTRTMKMNRFQVVGQGHVKLRIKLPCNVADGLSLRQKKVLGLQSTASIAEQQKVIDKCLAMKTEEERKKCLEQGIELEIPNRSHEYYLVADKNNQVFAHNKITKRLESAVEMLTLVDSMPEDLKWARETFPNYFSSTSWFARKNERFMIDAKEPKYSSKVINLNNVIVTSDEVTSVDNLDGRPELPAKRKSTAIVDVTKKRPKKARNSKRAEATQE